jgi:hypothetical protein
MPSTPQAPAIFERGDFARMSTAAPLWEDRRGQIANLWLYAYCAILSPFIPPGLLCSLAGDPYLLAPL